MKIESLETEERPKRHTLAIIRTCLGMVWMGGFTAYFFVHGTQDGPFGHAKALLAIMLVLYFIGGVAELDYRVKGNSGTVFQEPFWAWFGIAWALAFLGYVIYLFVG